MELILKVCAVVAVGSIAVLLLKRTLPEMSQTAELTLLIVLVASTAGVLGRVIEVIFELGNISGLSREFILPLVKAVGISIVTKLSCDVCREGGMLSAATYVEILGGAVAVSLSAPLIFGLLGKFN